MSSPITQQCQSAIERWKGMAKWRNLWTILLFIIGVAIVIFLCLSILLFIRQTWVMGAATTVGTIVSGAATNWVVSRRNEAVKEDDKAYDEVVQKCALPAAPGVKGLGTPVPVLPSDVQNQIDEFKKSQKILFGSIR